MLANFTLWRGSAIPCGGNRSGRRRQNHLPKKLPQLVSRQFALLRLRGFQFWVTAGTEEHSYRVTPAS